MARSWKREIRVHACLCAVVMLAGMVDHARACNVPAFRYALERWPADPYQILVYHRAGPQGAGFEFLEKGAANYSLKSVDVTKPEGKALADERGIVSYPWVEVYYPIQSQIRTPVWSGPLSLDCARKIVNSPGRFRLARSLLGGDVAVWVLIRSGHEQKDRRALETLQTHLKRAAATMRIPDTGADANGNPIEVSDYRNYPVRFSVMEIAHDDADEELLVRALVKSEPDLERYGEPIVFPVFGRGRALYALAGDGIQEKNIREACASMLAWCSCEIKALSPGTDLLVAADWSRPFGGRMVKDPELPLTGPSAFLQKKEPAKTAVPAPAPAPAPHAGEGPLARNVLYLAGAAGALLLVFSVILTVKAKR